MRKECLVSSIRACTTLRAFLENLETIAIATVVCVADHTSLNHGNHLYTGIGMSFD